MSKRYDSQCHALAQVFLADIMPLSPLAAKLSDQLAQEIQDVIEAFIQREVPHQTSRACWCDPIVEDYRKHGASLTPREPPSNTSSAFTAGYLSRVVQEFVRDCDSGHGPSVERLRHALAQVGAEALLHVPDNSQDVSPAK